MTDDALPPEMLKSAEAFGNSILSIGKRFGFTRHMTDGKTRSAVVVFMCDDHPMAAVLHQIIRAACCEAEVNGTSMGFNKDEVLKSLVPGP